MFKSKTNLLNSFTYDADRINKSCCLCLRPNQDISIKSPMNDLIKYIEVVNSLVPYNITNIINFPDKICKDCASKLLLFYEFRQKCEQSNNIISSILDSIKNTIDSNDAIDEAGNISDNSIDYFVCSPQMTFYANTHTKLDDVSMKLGNNYESEKADNFESEKDENSIDWFDAHIERDSDREENLLSFNNGNIETIKPEVKNFECNYPHQCEYCGRIFKRLHSLDHHRRTKHTDAIREYQCDLCKTVFMQKTRLIVHMRSHFNLKIFTCDVCNTECVDNMALKSHRLIHTGEKKFPCDTCGKRFLRKTDLRKHKKIHTGARPYRCKFCSKTYTSPAGLKKHNIKFCNADLKTFQWN